MPKGKKTKPKHTHFREGARVLIKLSDGTKFVDKFIKLGRTSIEFEKRGKINLIDISMITRGYQKFNFQKNKNNERRE